MTYRTLPVLVLVVSACVASTAVDETSSQLVGASTVVSLTFDDTLADQFQVGDLAAARGMHVTFYVNSPRLGQAGYMTTDQLLALQQAGNEIGGHTLDHANLTTLSDADARTEICNDRVALLDAGFAVTSFAYPFGANNSAVDQIVADCNYNSGRDVGGLVTPGSCNGCPYANTIPPADLYSLRTNDSIDSTTTLDTMELYVTQAEQNGGGYVPIVMHHVCDGCNTESVSATQLAAFMDWLAARGPATQVATVNEVIGGPVKPPVTAQQTSGGTNLLKNPSLETDADGNQIPDCWQRGGFGTNTGTYSLTSAAFDGNVAQTITVTSWSSGARRLVSAQDSGACAPAATAGHTYTMTAYYKATTQPRFTVYYRNSSGSWVYWTQSPLLPTASSYVQASFTTPALPSGATAISLGLGIFNVGTITMDAYTLVDNSSSPPPPPSDTTPPSLAIACNGAACATTAYASPVTVSLSASDTGSGVAEIRYTTDGSDPTTGTLYTAPFTVGTTSTVRATAVDNAGNRTTQSTTITIQSSTSDTTPPTLAIACNGAACASTAYASAVTVSLSASDAGSGVAEIRYTTDGSDPTTGTLYTAPFTVATTSTVRATAVDNAGNRTTQSVTITIGSSPPPPSNLLQNASLEVDANGDQVPDCWKRGGYGTNTATFTLTTDAFDGSVAQRIDITSWSSGGRRLVSAQDSGACAPAATAGHTYTMTAYYKSNVQPKFTVYYRNASGTWSYLAESPSFPASSTYRQATYTSPPLPAGTTAISIGLSIFSVGTLTSDAYTLVDASP